MGKPLGQKLTAQQAADRNAERWEKTKDTVKKQGSILKDPPPLVE